MIHAELRDASVIVVEDNADNLYILMDILKEDVGVTHCNACTSGRQLFTLLEMLPETNIDLILLDIQIPYEDGYTVLHQIRGTPRLHQTTVVAVTANVMPQDVVRARTAGFDGFIGKPIDSDRFPSQIRRILGGESVWEPR
ncbi:response regulator [Chloroflexales bacterium ZM16-3]|nr:response regulator [Chloroflexales bacterium ZM16-3]